MRKIDSLFPVWALLGLVIPALAGFVLSGFEPIAALTAFVWAGLVRVFLLHHATWSVNSICHMYGKRPFETEDESRNNWLVAFVSLGEGWHHSHHAFPTSARHGLQRLPVRPLLRADQAVRAPRLGVERQAAQAGAARGQASRRHDARRAGPPAEPQPATAGARARGGRRPLLSRTGRRQAPPGHPAPGVGYVAGCGSHAAPEPAGRDHGLVRRRARLDGRQRRAAGDRGGPRRRPRGPAVGLQRLPAGARGADPRRRVAGRRVRRAAGLLARRARVRRDVDRVRARAEHRGARGRARAPGRVRRAARAERAGRDRDRVPARAARCGGRLVAGVVGHRDRGRAARRRAADRLRVVALDLRDQRAVRRADAGAGGGGGAAAPAARRARRRSTGRARRCRSSRSRGRRSR